MINSGEDDERRKEEAKEDIIPFVRSSEVAMGKRRGEPEKKLPD